MIADAAAELGRWSGIAFVDARPTEDLPPRPWPVLHGYADLLALRDDFRDAAVGIGDNRRRMAVIDELRAAENTFDLPEIVHPCACVSLRADIGPGSVILGNAVVNAAATIGRGCIINTAATIDHDCQLADGVHVSPGAHLAGGVWVDELAWIGIGSCVIEGVRIGQGAVVAAGAVVIEDVPAGETVVGAPARPK